MSCKWCKPGRLCGACQIDQRKANQEAAKRAEAAKAAREAMRRKK